MSRSLAFVRVSSTTSALENQMILLLDRYERQNGRPELPKRESALIAQRLGRIIGERGLPPRLARDEMGEPGEMTADTVAPMMAEILDGLSVSPEQSVVIRQLVKACFHPEFKKCRESYREREDDGSCRRQALERVRSRVSGSHCIDCPYWTALTAEQNAACLVDGWAGDTAAFREHRHVFLPEDFRIFRQLLRAYPRSGDFVR